MNSDLVFINSDLVLIACAGVGDVLICTPTIRALKETYPKRKLIVYCLSEYHREPLLHNPYIDSLRDARRLWRWPHHAYLYFFNRRLLFHNKLDFQRVSPACAFDKNVVDLVPELFGRVELKTRKVQLFFTKDEEQRAQEALAEYQNVVFLHIYSSSGENHHWPTANWGKLVSELPQFTFIQLGLASEPHVDGAVDWRGKTSLREALCLIKHGQSFAGVDGSFAHATNAFDIPGVVLFGDSNPLHWGHENNINVYKDVECSPCALWKIPCPFQHECMETITVAEVKEALVRQMDAALVHQARRPQFGSSVFRMPVPTQ